MAQQQANGSPWQVQGFDPTKNASPIKMFDPTQFAAPATSQAQYSAPVTNQPSQVQGQAQPADQQWNQNWQQQQQEQYNQQSFGTGAGEGQGYSAQSQGYNAEGQGYGEYNGTQGQGQTYEWNNTGQGYDPAFNQGQYYDGNQWQQVPAEGAQYYNYNQWQNTDGYQQQGLVPGYEGQHQQGTEDFQTNTGQAAGMVDPSQTNGQYNQQWGGGAFGEGPIDYAAGNIPTEGNTEHSIENASYAEQVQNNAGAVEPGSLSPPQSAQIHVRQPSDSEPPETNSSEEKSAGPVMFASSSFSNLPHDPSPFDSIGSNSDIQSMDIPKPESTEKPDLSENFLAPNDMTKSFDGSQHSRQSSFGGIGVKFIVGSDPNSANQSASESPRLTPPEGSGSVHPAATAPAALHAPLEQKMHSLADMRNQQMEIDNASGIAESNAPQNMETEPKQSDTDATNILPPTYESSPARGSTSERPSSVASSTSQQSSVLGRASSVISDGRAPSVISEGGAEVANIINPPDNNQNEPSLAAGGDNSYQIFNSSQDSEKLHQNVSEMSDIPISDGSTVANEGLQNEYPCSQDLQQENSQQSPELQSNVPPNTLEISQPGTQSYEQQAAQGDNHQLNIYASTITASPTSPFQPVLKQSPVSPDKMTPQSPNLSIASQSPQVTSASPSHTNRPQSRGQKKVLQNQQDLPNITESLSYKVHNKARQQMMSPVTTLWANPEPTSLDIRLTPSTEVAQPAVASEIQPTLPVSASTNQPTPPVSAPEIQPTLPVFAPEIQPTLPVSAQEIQPTLPVSAPEIRPTLPVSSPQIQPTLHTPAFNVDPSNPDSFQSNHFQTNQQGTTGGPLQGLSQNAAYSIPNTDNLSNRINSPLQGDVQPQAEFAQNTEPAAPVSNTIVEASLPQEHPVPEPNIPLYTQQSSDTRQPVQGYAPTHEIHSSPVLSAQNTQEIPQVIQAPQAESDIVQAPAVSEILSAPPIHTSPSGGFQVSASEENLIVAPQNTENNPSGQVPDAAQEPPVQVDTNVVYGSTSMMPGVHSQSAQSGAVNTQSIANNAPPPMMNPASIQNNTALPKQPQSPGAAVNQNMLNSSQINPQMPPPASSPPQQMVAQGQPQSSMGGPGGVPHGHAPAPITNQGHPPPTNSAPHNLDNQGQPLAGQNQVPQGQVSQEFSQTPQSSQAQSPPHSTSQGQPQPQTFNPYNPSQVHSQHGRIQNTQNVPQQNIQASNLPPQQAPGSNMPPQATDQAQTMGPPPPNQSMDRGAPPQGQNTRQRVPETGSHFPQPHTDHHQSGFHPYSQQQDNRGPMPPPQNNPVPASNPHVNMQESTDSITREYNAGPQNNTNPNYDRQQSDKQNDQRRDDYRDRRDPRYDDRRDPRYDDRSRDPRYDDRYRDYRGYDRQYDQYGGYYDQGRYRSNSRSGYDYDYNRPRSRQGYEYGQEDYYRPRSRQEYSNDQYNRPNSRQGYDGQRPPSRAESIEDDQRSRSSSRPSSRQGQPEAQSRGDYSGYGDERDYYDRNKKQYRDQYYYDRNRDYYDRGQYYDYYSKDTYNRGYEAEMQSYYKQDPRYQGYDDRYAYDQRYANRGYYDDVDRHSQHSMHSRGTTPNPDQSAADHFAQDGYGSRPHSRQSGIFEQSPIQRGADATAHGYYESSYNQSYTGYDQYGRQQPEVKQEPVRVPTPAKFTLPHTRATFGPSGMLVKVLPHNPVNGQTATVEIQSISDLLQELPENAELKQFPGPLTVRETHPDEVLQFCKRQIQACQYNPEITDKTSAQLIWKYIELLVVKNGNIMGTDVADLLLEGHDPATAEYSKLANRNLAGSDANLTTSETPPEDPNAVTAQGFDKSSIIYGGDDGTIKFRWLLQHGKSKEALDWAMKKNLWGHALFLASKMDAKMHATILTRFANVALHATDPLQTLFQLMSGRQPSAATLCGDRKLFGDWRPHLAMVLSNANPSRPDLTRKSITTMGDTLAAKSLFHASHLCYLLAQVPFGTFTKKSSKIVLIGSSHGVPLEQFANNLAIQTTEIYEYARSLCQAMFVLPSFQVFKFIYAARLAEAGMVEEALHYCEIISTAIITQPGLYSSELANLVLELSNRLKFHVPSRQYSADDSMDPEWIQYMGHVAQQFQAGQIQPIAEQTFIDSFAQQAQQSYNYSYYQQQQQNTEGVAHQQGSETQSVHSDTQSATGAYDQNYGAQMMGYGDNTGYTAQQQWDANALAGQMGNMALNATSDNLIKDEPDAGQIQHDYLQHPDTGDIKDEPEDPLSSSINTQSTTKEESDPFTQQEPTPSPKQQAPNFFDLHTDVHRYSRPGIPTPPSSTPKGSASSPPISPLSRGSMGSPRTPHSPPKEVFQFGQPVSPYTASAKPLGGGSVGSSPPGSPGTMAPPKKKQAWPGDDGSDDLSKGNRDGPGKNRQDPKGHGKKGWFSNWFNKKSNEMKLPDDKEPSIVWDAEKKEWINSDGSTIEQNTAPPPPTDMDMSGPPALGGGGGGGGPPGPPGMAGPPSANKFSLQKARGARNQYVDIMKGSALKTSATAPANLFDVLPNAAAKSSASIFQPNTSLDGAAKPEETQQQPPANEQAPQQQAPQQQAPRQQAPQTYQAQPDYSQQYYQQNSQQQQQYQQNTQQQQQPQQQQNAAQSQYQFYNPNQFPAQQEGASQDPAQQPDQSNISRSSSMSSLSSEVQQYMQQPPQTSQPPLSSAAPPMAGAPPSGMPPPQQPVTAPPTGMPLMFNPNEMQAMGTAYPSAPTGGGSGLRYGARRTYPK